ncbi:MAG TPA: AraC family transcriptional regulator ligand-binding domain-containing protein [Polyangiales bacterium]|nr:AraC family transcriptional regulator ligand-binding domain-containing protein [Polyangiales bacterium]
MEQMSCNGRFVRPFVRVLARYPRTAASLEKLRAIGQEERVNLAAAYESLNYWVKSTGDRDLGLKAGATVRLGEGGALDFAMHSAATLRESVEIASRHSRLFSDGIDPKLELSGERAIVRLDNKLPWPRAAADFTLAAWYALHIRVQLPEQSPVEVWFAHEQPASLTEYERAFPGASLRFDAPYYGFAFAAELADTPLVSGDGALHAAHCEHLEFLQARLWEPRSFALRVRELVACELRRGRPTSWDVARQLQISRRTLVRRLNSEGTNFKTQLDELRRQLALNLVARPQPSLVEITSLLGFSQVQAFHRAFRRWTGQTPMQYRELAQQNQLAQQQQAQQQQEAPRA